jgi:hypothetical protein
MRYVIGCLFILVTYSCQQKPSGEQSSFHQLKSYLEEYSNERDEKLSGAISDDLRIYAVYSESRTNRNFQGQKNSLIIDSENKEDLLVANLEFVTKEFEGRSCLKFVSDPVFTGSRFCLRLTPDNGEAIDLSAFRKGSLRFRAKANRPLVLDLNLQDESGNSSACQFFVGKEQTEIVIPVADMLRCFSLVGAPVRCLDLSHLQSAFSVSAFLTTKTELQFDDIYWTTESPDVSNRRNVSAVVDFSQTAQAIDGFGLDLSMINFKISDKVVAECARFLSGDKNMTFKIAAGINDDRLLLANWDKDMITSGYCRNGLSRFSYCESGGARKSQVSARVDSISLNLKRKTSLLIVNRPFNISKFCFQQSHFLSGNASVWSSRIRNLDPEKAGIATYELIRKELEGYAVNGILFPVFAGDSGSGMMDSTSLPLKITPLCRQVYNLSCMVSPGMRLVRPGFSDPDVKVLAFTSGNSKSPDIAFFYNLSPSAKNIWLEMKNVVCKRFAVTGFDKYGHVNGTGDMVLDNGKTSFSIDGFSVVCLRCKKSR